MNINRTFILEDNMLKIDEEIVMDAGKNTNFVFQFYMTDEFKAKVKPDYVLNQTYVLIQFNQLNKQEKFKCKMYSNMLVIKGNITLDTPGELTANIYFRNPNKKLVKLPEFRITVEDENFVLPETEVVKTSSLSEQAVHTNATLSNQMDLLGSILDIKNNIGNVAKTYLEEELSDQIGTKWYDGTGNPNNTFGANNDYYLNIVNSDIFKMINGQWERIGNIRGTKGVQGDRGPIGLQGIEGNPGPQGEQGLQGEQGKEGPIGLQGLTGPAGSQGPKGEKGDRGSNGTTWFDGIGIPPEERGSEGDYYLNLENGDVYSKFSGVWHRKGNLGSGGNSGGAIPDGDYATIDFVVETVTNVAVNKVDKVPGKQLTEHDFTSLYKQKLDTLYETGKGPQGDKGDQGPMGPAGPQGPSVQSDWQEVNSASLAFIKNKPMIAKELGQLTDVNIIDKQNGDILAYNEATGKWEPVALRAGETRTALSYDEAQDKWIPKTVTADSGGDGSCGGLEENIIVKGVNVGNLKDGDILPAGMSLTQFVRQLVVKRIPPTYTLPTASLTSDIGTKFETGSIITPKITTLFNVNDGGNVTRYRLYEGDVLVQDQDSLQSYTKSIALVDNVKFRVSVDYADGPVKNDNLGNPYPNGKVIAGTLNNTMTISAVRAFWGAASDLATEPNSDTIRNTEITDIDLKVNDTIQVSASPSTRTIFFAYPASLRDCTKIRYEELGDDDNKTAFNQKIIQIADASGANPVDYRVYYYTSPIEFGSIATFTLTV